jgi:general secretion pathway protein A
MYEQHFNLTGRPFSIAPDPRFLYMSARHREALAHLIYGLGEDGGFVQLTGEVGTGKTTICRCLLEQVPENVDLAMVLNPKVTAKELIATLCDELGIEHPGEDASFKTLTDTLNRFLLDTHSKGRRTVLVIDEAQNLNVDVLEQVRLLTNLETATQKLLQIILIGQPELRTLLAQDEMRQLSQRVTARYHLEPLSHDETVAYIRHRLDVSGSSKNIFSRGAIDTIHQLSAGIPRLINVLCDRAMLGAFVEGKGSVDRKVVKKAAREVLEEKPATTGRRWGGLAVAAALVVAVLAVFVAREGSVLPFLSAQPDVVPASVPAQPAVPVAKQTPQPVPPAPVAAQPETEPGPSLAAILYAAEEGEEALAWRELFSLWSVEANTDTGGNYCSLANEYGLECLEDRGTWSSLRDFDRPALLQLVTSDGRKVSVLLEQLDDGVARLNIAGEIHDLPVEQVGRYWYGDYTLLIQAPPGRRMFLRSGDRDPDVVWLREQVERIHGVKIETGDPQLFDSHLQSKVREFQKSLGLLPDGIVGRKTLIHLNTEAGREGVPRLSTEQS